MKNSNLDKMFAPKVLFEDEQLMVIDKPAGMVVNNSETTKAETVEGWLANNFQFEIFNFQEMRHGIVHRLDKETSGVLVIAKTSEAFENLQKQFAERGVEKSYLALVHGKVTPAEGVIDAPVGRLPWNRERFGVLPDGRAAETHYRMIQGYKGQGSGGSEDFSLVELTPKTGRTHQLRVHLKSIGHAVVADQFYAGRKTARNDRKWCPRLFLHAKSISFAHPKTGEKVEVSSELAPDLTQALAQLS